MAKGVTLSHLGLDIVVCRIFLRMELPGTYILAYVRVDLCVDT